MPPEKRRKCIFRKSCSKHVYEITTNEGFVAGLNAFIYRFKNCRSGAYILESPSGETQIILPNQQILNEIEISERFIKNKNNHGKICDQPKGR